MCQHVPPTRDRNGRRIGGCEGISTACCLLGPKVMTRAVRRSLGWILFAAVPVACSGSVKIEQGAADSGAAGRVMTVPPSSGGASSQDGGASPDAAVATAGSGARASHGIPLCQSPTYDRTSQLVVCANGFAHRAQPSACGSEPSAGSGGAPADNGQSNAGAGGESKYGAACSDDSDCVWGTACVCNPTAYLPDMSLVRIGEGACVLATCRTDADCNPGSYCAVGNLNFFGEADPGFGCLRDDDECTTDADCNSSDGYICFEQTRRTCSLPPE